jgi:hypothetical protein
MNVKTRTAFQEVLSNDLSLDTWSRCAGKVHGSSNLTRAESWVTRSNILDWERCTTDCRVWGLGDGATDADPGDGRSPHGT